MKQRLIDATFKNGTTATYTTAIYRLLITDPLIDYITDHETGEILFAAN